ncbi:hypothetical protein PMAYCL1PPCAC_04897 [Pristionchus mayeri]|uniref:C-type lectin domain-containing protein n=1 Tax=Pristionchus mayeri TaxID=1317129 RepID=A0AAN4Z566_9BILA|nr:hypothetical protein PMAYCL1PPCAC_04897 [Pristionchus mayeri]
MKMLPPLSPPDEDQECSDFSDDAEEGICYQVGAEPARWMEAHFACMGYSGTIASIHNTQENSFIRRLAVSKGQVNGVFLGASIVGKNDNFSWTDRPGTTRTSILASPLLEQAVV